MTSTPTVWKPAGDAVEQRLGPLVATLHRAGPAPRLEVTAATGRRDDLLGLDLRAAAQPADEWLRGCDAVAIYEPDDPRRLRATAMWRIAAAAPGASGAWELVVSAQTSLLESDASLTVTSEVHGDELLAAEWPAGGAGLAWRPVTGRRGPAATTGCLLVRRRDDATSVLVAVHPGDARGLAASSAGGRVRIACALFRSQVEKGVLLRGRVLAAIGPAAGDEAWAAAVATAFAASPPVLET
jgi:hypothetical protein